MRRLFVLLVCFCVGGAACAQGYAPAVGSVSAVAPVSAFRSTSTMPLPVEYRSSAVLGSDGLAVAPGLSRGRGGSMPRRLDKDEDDVPTGAPVGAPSTAVVALVLALYGLLARRRQKGLDIVSTGEL